MMHSYHTRSSNWSDQCTPCNAVQDCLPPYLPGLVPRLQQLLAQGQKLVQEGALTALASVADSTKLAFAPFYVQVLPLP